MRGRNARKKTKRRKRPPRSDEGPRTSADIRQEIAELDEEGFREDAARNAQAAKIQARIRGRKARREAAPKRAALQRARADARALADKVAALEAENARLRQQFDDAHQEQREKIRDIQDHNAEELLVKNQEIEDLKRNIKSTKLTELQEEIQLYQKECLKLRYISEVSICILI